MFKSFKDVDSLTHGGNLFHNELPLHKNLFYKSPWCTVVYINPYSERSSYHTHMYQHARWRHYLDTEVQGHEYILTLKHTESSIVFSYGLEFQWSN